MSLFFWALELGICFIENLDMFTDIPLGFKRVHKQVPKTWSRWERYSCGSLEVSLGSWFVGFETIIYKSGFNFIALLTFL